MIPHGKFDPRTLAKKNAPPEANVTINLQDAEDIICEECGGKTFDIVVMLKKLSALLSPTGKEERINIQTLACHSCGHINKEFEPGL